MQIKLENNTLNSVLDCDSNKTNTLKGTKDMLKGAKVIFGEKVWLSDTLFILFEYIVYRYVYFTLFEYIVSFTQNFLVV
jgi:hypothetical protein